MLTEGVDFKTAVARLRHRYLLGRDARCNHSQRQPHARSPTTCAR